MQVFDRISSKSLPPIRMPLSEAVQSARDAADALRELEHRRDADHRDLQELRDLLCRPHFKVSFCLFTAKKNRYISLPRTLSYCIRYGLRDGAGSIDS